MTNDDPSASVAIVPAEPADAAGIAAVHVATWRSAYPGLIPDHALRGLSATRLSQKYKHDILQAPGVFVARDLQRGGVVGFTTASCAAPGALAAGEIETLYVADDWREQGLGRALLIRASRFLASEGCTSLFLWVLADNPSRWFYERMGGRPVQTGATRVGGLQLETVAMRWERIESLTGSA